jgi:hypothetical protein
MDYSLEIDNLQNRLFEGVVLNENFFKTIQNWPTEKLLKYINVRYNKVEKLEDKSESVLVSNNIDVPLLKKLITSELHASKSKIKDTNKVSNIKKIKEVISGIFTKLKSIQWLGKDVDPTAVIPYLILFVGIFSCKMYLLLLLNGVFASVLPVGQEAVGISIAMKTALAVLLLPILEESGKFLSVKAGSTVHEKYHIMFNVVNFLAMTGLMVMLSNVSLIGIIFWRVLDFVVQVGTSYHMKNSKDEQKETTGYVAATSINIIRYTLEMACTGAWLVG